MGEPLTAENLEARHRLLVSEAVRKLEASRHVGVVHDKVGPAQRSRNWLVAGASIMRPNGAIEEAFLIRRLDNGLIIDWQPGRRVLKPLIFRTRDPESGPQGLMFDYATYDLPERVEHYTGNGAIHKFVTDPDNPYFRSGEEPVATEFWQIDTADIFEADVDLITLGEGYSREIRGEVHRAIDVLDPKSVGFIPAHSNRLDPSVAAEL